ncbi:MAG: hypothetical protein ABI702_06850 [Burkholderiales bacterium]
MRKTLWILAAALGAIAAPAQALDGESLSVNPDQLPWARWQGRLSLGTSPSGGRPGLDVSRVSNANLMGDYYFARSLASLGGVGGFRATSGLIFGPRSSLAIGQPSLSAGSAFSIGSRLFGQGTAPNIGDAAVDNATLPYLGVGYTGASARSGWSFSADLGLVAQSPGGVKVIRSQSLDDAIREMRLAPLVQLGVSYAF